MSTQAQKTRRFNKTSEIVCFIIALLLMFGFRFIPAPDPITPYGMALIGVFAGLIFGWCTLSDTLPTSLFGIIAYGITLSGGVYGGLTSLFSGYVTLLMLVSFFAVGALLSSGASEWLVYKVCTAKFAKGHPWILMTVVFYGTWIVGTFTNMMIVILFVFSILSILFKQAGFKPGDKTPVMMILNLSCAYLMGCILFPWQAPQVMVIQALAGIGIIVSPAKYMLTVLITAFIIMAVGLLLMKIMGCEVERFTEIDFSFLEEKYEKGLTTYQKAVLFCMISICLGNLVISLFPKSLGLYDFLSVTFSIFGWMLFVTGIMLFVQIDGKRLLSPSDMAAHFSWDVLLIISLGVTVGLALPTAETGVGVWLSAVLGPILSNTPEIMIYVVVGIAALVLTNFLNNNVVVIMIATTVIALAGQGLIGNPIVPCIIVVLAGNLGFYTPAASFVGALNHTHEYTTATAIYKYGLIVFAAMIAVCCVILPLIVNIVF